MNVTKCMMISAIMSFVLHVGSGKPGTIYAMDGADALDVTRIHVESQAAREFLKNETIAVREKRTSFLPKGELPIVQLKRVDDEVCKEELRGVMRRYSAEKADGREIQEMAEILTARVESASFWIHRGSGAYKFTETKPGRAIRRSKITHFARAVQLALDYVGRNQPVTLARDEEMDVLFVSGVQNAVAVANKAKPIDEYISAYYVAFGRRFKGIPVIGSQLVMRLSADEHVAMVQRNWRQIKAVSDQRTTVSTKSIPELMLEEPSFRERYDAKWLKPEDISIADAQCGYLEAPLDYVQDFLRPGCNVSFFVGQRREESLAQTFVPLEEGETVEKLLGSKYRERK